MRIHLQVYRGVVTRTNIDIDDDLVGKVMRTYRLDSKRSAVEFALQRLIGESLSDEDVLAMRGTGFDFTNDEVEAYSRPE
jgi:Arc/MetJ family transcription regulator